MRNMLDVVEDKNDATMNGLVETGMEVTRHQRTIVAASMEALLRARIIPEVAATIVQILEVSRAMADEAGIPIQDNKFES